VAQIIADIEAWVDKATPGERAVWHEHHDAQAGFTFAVTPDRIRALVDEVRRLEGHIAKQQMDIVELGIMAGRAVAAEAEFARLQDPNAVHVNMLRGTIAKPTWSQIEHLYTEEAARLREPAGEVGEMVKRMSAPVPTVYDCQDAADLLTRQAAEIERLNNLLVMVRATGDAHKTAFQSNEASLREAVEVMRGIADIARTTVGPGYSAIQKHARAFLDKLETKP
jgi:hypothetical protein